jgi:SpoVK/Ycf46/Vps4 family AAA+-type ATPase
VPVERLQEVLNFNRGERLFLLYGPGVMDRFVLPDFTEREIGGALLDLLKSQGFERIVLYSSAHWIFFLDQESLDRSSPPTKPKTARGPLGDTEQIIPVPEMAPPSGGGFQRGDAAAIGQLDDLMRGESAWRTALVFLDAETTLGYLAFNQASRQFAGLLYDWMSSPSRKQNVCVAVFSSPELEGLRNWFSNIALNVPVLHSSFLAKAGQLIRIGGPSREETSRIVDSVRLVDGLAVDWNRRRQLEGWMAAEGRKGSEWLSILRRAGSSGGAFDRDTARKARWFTSMPADDRPAIERLDSLIGLQKVKDLIRKLTGRMEVAARLAKEDGAADTKPALHLMFTGNPGTGKTTVARLMGEIYRDVGLLSRGHLVEAQAGDLVGEYLGQTFSRTDAKVNEAIGGVLFVDEAYRLAEGQYQKEALETLLVRMENDRHRLMVIVAGYTTPMLKDFLPANPGLRRRFPPENIIEFPDYTPEELMQILRAMSGERRLAWDDGAGAAIREVVEGLHATRDQTFGNAGDMRNLLEAMANERSSRIHEGALPLNEPIRAADIPESYRSHLRGAVPDVDELLKEVDGYIGLQPVKDFVRRQVRRIRIDRMRQAPSLHADPPAHHMVFTGNPGTGKTTVANLMGRVFRSLGILRRGHVVPASRDTLVADYVGQTATKTADKLKEALDGVLFIDEAYTLARDEGSPHNYGQEAIDTILLYMENHRDRLVVIAAGYPEQMRAFIRTNPGLESRFGLFVDFPDYSPDELYLILERFARRDGFAFSPDAEQAARAYLDWIYVNRTEGFGNARKIQHDVLRKIVDRLYERVENAGLTAPEEINRILPEDIPDWPARRSASRSWTN